ncbi:MAG TPA: AAA family ATPase, partial [Blastocatellia bacterium]
MYDMKLKDLISETLCTATDNAPYLVGRSLAELYPERYVLFGRDYEFDITEFARHGHCHIVTEAALFNQFTTEWWGPGTSLRVRPENGLFNVFWDGQIIDVLYISWQVGWCRRRHHWITAESNETAQRFLGAVCEFSCEVTGEVLVFEDGNWFKDKRLYKSIKDASLDRIVLAGNMKADILGDLVKFFDSAETYAQYGVPWKRGVILIGPPGNGKTGMVKALVNELKKPCLYVKSFDCKGTAPQENIRDVFERARRSAPCVMV